MQCLRIRKDTLHNCLASRKIPILKVRVLNYFTYSLCFVNISTKGAKSENDIVCFYTATFEYFINCCEAANFEFLKAKF
jgi:hypothetical protein